LANENRTQDAGHALLRQGRNPKVRKNSGVITYFGLVYPIHQTDAAYQTSECVSIANKPITMNVSMVWNIHTLLAVLLFTCSNKLLIHGPHAIQLSTC